MCCCNAVEGFIQRAPLLKAPHLDTAKCIRIVFCGSIVFQYLQRTRRHVVQVPAQQRKGEMIEVKQLCAARRLVRL